MTRLPDKTTRQDEHDTPPSIEKLPPLDAPPDFDQPIKRAAKSKSDVSWLFVILAGVATLLLLTVIIGGNLFLWFNSDERPPIVAVEATPTEISVPVAPSVTPTLEADARVSVLLAPLWANPNLEANTLITYPEDTLLRILARNEDNSWLQVEAPEGQVGWMLAEMLEVNIALDEVAVVVVEPTPQATQTAVVIEEAPTVEPVIVPDQEPPDSAPITAPAIEAPAVAIEAPAPAIEAPAAPAPATEPSSGGIQPNIELPDRIELEPIDATEVLGLPEVELPADLALPEIELPLAEGGLPNLDLPSLEQLAEIELPIGEGLPAIELPGVEGLPELPIGEGLPAIEVPLVEGLPELPGVEGLPELPIGEGLPAIEVPLVEGLPELPSVEGLPELPVVEGLPELPVVEGLPELPSIEGLPELPVGEGLPNIELPVGEGLPNIEIPIGEALPPIEIPIGEGLSGIGAELPTEIELPLLPPIKIEWP